jgi:hypothetical protein
MPNQPPIQNKQIPALKSGNAGIWILLAKAGLAS